MPAASLSKQVKDVGSTLRRLERQLRGVVRALAKESQATAARAVAGAKPAVRRKLRISPARRRALKLQGRYLGYMRQLKLAQKARVKALKAKKGMRAAIAMARKLAGR